jgi:c-di-GMP-binding flagellar brake protein YcgR
MARQKLSERRKYRRLQAEENTFALLKGQVSKLGRLMDISQGGLAFRYVSIGERLEGPLELDLVTPKDDLRLNGLPVRVVSNFGMRSKTPSGPIKLRRVGVQFRELTHDQQSQLDHFIRNYTVGDT